MISFMLSISFVLHIILITIVFLLYKQIQVLKSKDANDIMEILEVYLEEIKIENKRLEQDLQSRETHNKVASLHKVSEPQTINQDRQVKEEIEDTKEDLADLEIDHVDDTFEPSLEVKVLQLHNKGFTEDDIAKQLNCGKTEAALIIKLYSK